MEARNLAGLSPSRKGDHDVSDRDWRFATLTFVVLLELIASAVAALVFNRKI